MLSLLPPSHGVQRTLDLAHPPEILSRYTYPPLTSHSPDHEMLLLTHLYDPSVPMIRTWPGRGTPCTALTSWPLRTLTLSQALLTC